MKNADLSAMAKVNPDVALKESQVLEICYHTRLRTDAW
jgi:hypothetical protein